MRFWLVLLRSEVYKIILSDVNDAVAKLPVVSFSTKWFCYTRFCTYAIGLCLDDNAPLGIMLEQRAQLREILKMGYELQTNYASVFEPLE